MRVILTGAGGQLARELASTASTNVQLIELDSRALDITRAAEVERRIVEISPDIILNSAAFTAVDRAEVQIARAMAVNRDGVGNLAQSAAQVGARLVQISTDFIFDGSSGRPYRPTDRPSPLSIYGRSKLAGEQAAGAEALIVRTAWLYSHHAANFVTTMLRLMKERQEIRVVADQVGTPTWARNLAKAIWRLVDVRANGVYHFTDAGVASWYDFAVAIYEEATALDLLTTAVDIIPIATSDFPTAAQRPSYSVLDKFETYQVLGFDAPHWRTALREMLKDLKDNG